MSKKSKVTNSPYILKPMLAVAWDDSLDRLNYPVIVSPKLDGIRCLIINGKAVSRKLKPIPNHHIRNLLEQHCPDGFDGEIIVPFASFNEIQSQVMTEEGTPEFEYWVFDWYQPNLPYIDRLNNLNLRQVDAELPNFVKILDQGVAADESEIKQFEEIALSRGFEGLMIRSLDGPYKFGRSTAREGYLLKLKRFKDAEAVVIGFEEKLHNANEATVDELGYTKRSSHKANLTPAGTLGTLLVKDMNSNWQFGIGTGFDDALRAEIWNNQAKYLGKIVTYRYQEVGMLERPRFPSFKGFRDPRDL